MDTEMTHRQIIKEWLGNLAFVDQEIVDWGSGSKPAMRYINHKNCHFTTVDNAPGIPQDRKGKYHVDADISLPIYVDPKTLKKFDIAFCIEVLEHVEDPQQLMVNIYNNLKPGGYLYLSAPFKYDIHAEVDYWRFTPNGLRLLLEQNGFQVVSINETRDEQGYMVEAYQK